jgi:hypothetical protein
VRENRLLHDSSPAAEAVGEKTALVVDDRRRTQS